MDWIVWLIVTAICSLIAVFTWRYAEKLQAEETPETVRIIKGNPKKAWPIWVLNSLLLMPLIVFAIWTDKKPIDCNHLFNINVTYLQLILLVFVMPSILTGIFIYQWREAKKSLKNGFFPPTNENYFFDTKALSIRLRRVKVKVYAILYFLPFYALILFGVSFVIYQKWQLDRDYTLIERQLEQKCLVIKHYP